MKEPRIEEFLTLLFDDVDGFIEIRVIEDRKGGKVVERRWYESVEDLQADLLRLDELAASKAAAVFCGVLPRKAPGAGKPEDVVPGLVAWVDIDFKDFDGGEKEARVRLASFPLQPSIIVCSGHGLHAYWRVREVTDPAELSRISRGLARALGGDHAHDAARLLRLPGTQNRKDPEKPILVEIELLQPDRAYNPCEIVAALELVGVSMEDRAENVSEAAGDIHIGDRLSDRVLALVDNPRGRVRALFEGKGKPAIGPDGKGLDTSSSGYDFSLALTLAMTGITDPSELAMAVWLRPDKSAQAKGVEYVRRTVRRALQRAKVASKGPAQEVDFRVEKVRIFDSDSPIYELTIDSRVIRLSSAQLKSRSKFETAFMSALRRLPALPQKVESWRALVNGWLADPEIVDLPPEASEEPALREAVEHAVTDLPVGEDVSDLHRGRALLLDGARRIFKADSLLGRLREDRPDLKRNDLCRVLRELGFVSQSVKVSGTTVRVWERVTPYVRARGKKE